MATPTSNIVTLAHNKDLFIKASRVLRKINKSIANKLVVDGDIKPCDVFHVVDKNNDGNLSNAEKKQLRSLERLLGNKMPMLFAKQPAGKPNPALTSCRKTYRDYGLAGPSPCPGSPEGCYCFSSPPYLQRFEKQNSTKNISISCKPGEACRLGLVVLFAANDTSLSDAGHQTIEQLAQLFLDTAPREGWELQNLWVMGHADNIGETRANKRISKRRARVVANALEEAGIDAKKIHTVGYGESRPRQAGKTADARQQNRRVEFVMTRQSEKEFAKARKDYCDTHMRRECLASDLDYMMPGAAWFDYCYETGELPSEVVNRKASSY